MREFSYNRQFPCPTDRYIYPIFEQYKKLKQTIVTEWCKGVANGLLSYRAYSDLDDTRLTTKVIGDRIVPVLSLKPVIGVENTQALEEYLVFFEIYDKLRQEIINQVEQNIFYKDKPNETRHLIVLVNLIKLFIKTWNMDAFNSIDFIVATSGQIIDHELAGQILHGYNASHDTGSVVGDHFINEKVLHLDVDSDLIGSFYRYTHALENHRQKVMSGLNCGVLPTQIETIEDIIGRMTGNVDHAIDISGEE